VCSVPGCSRAPGRNGLCWEHNLKAKNKSVATRTLPKRP
jgi:hypothetical protein